MAGACETKRRRSSERIICIDGKTMRLNKRKEGNPSYITVVLRKRYTGRWKRGSTIRRMLSNDCQTKRNGRG